MKNEGQQQANSRVRDPRREAEDVLTAKFIWTVSLLLMLLGWILYRQILWIPTVTEFISRLILAYKHFLALLDAYKSTDKLGTKIIKRKRKGKKLRRPKQVWFGCCQRLNGRRIQEQRKTELQELRETYTINKHRYLHLESYATEFQILLDRIVDFDLLFGANESFVHRTSRSSECKTVFHTNSPTVLDTQDILEFQTVYLSRLDTIPIVFDTGACISVSPVKDDFIHWEHQDPN